MSDVTLLILYVLLALVFSFLCSVAESVLLSITPSYIEGTKKSDPKRFKILKKLRQDNLDRSLAAILTLNTIAHTVGAIGSGAKAEAVFGSVWFGVFSAVMTIMVLVASEIIPKTLGAVYWSKLVGLTALFVNLLIIVLYPVVWISEKITKVISHGKEVHIFSREEFIAMAQVGVESGQIQHTESGLIQNALKFDSLRVKDIKTPRSVMTAFDAHASIDDSLQLATETPFSRLPIYEGNIDNVTGFILKEDVLINAAQKRGSENIGSLKRELISVPESFPLSTLLERLLKERQHIALVHNEYGDTSGLVTLEDLIETLIGMEIMDETDDVEDMRALARKQWDERAKKMGIKVDRVEDTQ